MVVLKAARKNSDAGDEIFKDAYERSGFVEKLSETISEMKRNLVTPQMLKNTEAKGILARKLSALASVYESYNEMFENDIKDPDENMQELARAIAESDAFSNTHIFIDGFSDFMPSHYPVIEELIKKACSVEVALTINEAGLMDGEGIYAPVVNSLKTLEKTAENCGAECKFIHLDGEYGYIKAEDIRYFLSNYEQYQPSCKKPECVNIKLSPCSNQRDEVQRLAGRIMYEIRENGLRFNEIGVIIGNPDSYLHIIDAVFTEYGIPYFADRKISASDHSVVRTILSVFKIISENWSFQSVFEYLRSGFIYKKDGENFLPIDTTRIDKLEIYCKTRGIRGKKAWLSQEAWKPIRKGIFDETTETVRDGTDVEELDTIRRELMKPFVNLMEKIKGRKTARELATALFEFLGEIYLYEGLRAEQERFEKKNMLDDASRIGDVWGAIIETIDQAVLVSGDEYMSRDDFAKMLEVGFSKCSLDTIPPGTDSVSVGRADTSRPVRVRVLFVLGAVRGEFPPEAAESGIVTDADRAVLSESGYDYLPDRQTKMKITEFNIFSSLTAACERLYVSYPQMNNDGTKNVPAGLIDELERTFGKIDSVTGEKDEWKNILASGENTYQKMVSRISSEITPDERRFWNELWESVLLEEKKNERSFTELAEENADLSIFDAVEDKRRDIISMLSEYKQGRTHIRPETAERLYCGRKLSITSMEKYNKCPFSYFAHYGLSLGSDTEYGVRGSDIGKMVHWSVCEFCRRVQENAQTIAEKKAVWQSLTDEKAREIISDIIKSVEQQTLEANPDFLAEKLALMCKRVENTIVNSAKVIKESITAGSFAAVEFEKQFNAKIEYKGDSVDIAGTIDRLDIAEDGDGKLIRIIDYKTGVQEFSVADIYNKTSLQLVIYALAAEQMYESEKGRISAVMYDKIRDELVRTELGSPVAISPSQLDGIIVTDDENADEEIIAHDGSLAEKDTRSTFLPLQTKKNGGLKKSGMLVSRSRFNMLSRYVGKIAVETKQNVLSGYIEPLPLGDDEYSPCAWCEYSSVCLHTKGKDRVRDKITAAAKAWEKIEEEDANG